jgi:hypothetical protein
MGKTWIRFRYNLESSNELAGQFIHSHAIAVRTPDARSV